MTLMTSEKSSGRAADCPQWCMVRHEHDVARLHMGRPVSVGPTCARLMQRSWEATPHMLVSGVRIAVEDGGLLAELFVKLRQKGAARVIRAVLAQLEEAGDGDG